MNLEQRQPTSGWIRSGCLGNGMHEWGLDVDVDVERKQAQAIASLPDSIAQLLFLRLGEKPPKTGSGSIGPRS